jgi:hypothetical protein
MGRIFWYKSREQSIADYYALLDMPLFLSSRRCTRSGKRLAPLQLCQRQSLTTGKNVVLVL